MEFLPHAASVFSVVAKNKRDGASRGAISLCMALSMCLFSSVAEAEERSPTNFFVSADVHASLLSDIANSSLLNPTVGWAVKGGYRPGAWGVFLQVEQDLWQSTDTSGKTVLGALNVALGGEFVYADRFLRTSVAAGSSTLLFDTILDDAGATGFFFDLRPVGLRWSPLDQLIINLDPLSFAIVAPVLSGIPLVQIEYRTVLGVEYEF